jgi:hypothetical protein
LSRVFVVQPVACGRSHEDLIVDQSMASQAAFEVSVIGELDERVERPSRHPSAAMIEGHREGIVIGMGATADSVFGFENPHTQAVVL